MNLKTCTCKGCGVGFAAPRKRGYCTIECRQVAYSHRKRLVFEPTPCKQCGTAFTPKRHADKYCGSRCRNKAPRRHLTCAWCGVQFGTNQRKGKVKHCSKECSLASKRGNRKPKRSEVSFCNCRVCGTAYCLSGLYKGGNCRRCRDRYPPHLINEIARGNMQKLCTGCGVSFSRIPGTKTQACSPQCSKRAHRVYKARRRLSARDGEKIDPLEIFFRDKWRCCHCKRKTPKSARGTHKSNAPELDHIVPLSKGGKHDRANVQLLCRECNGEKGSGSLHDQTRLFG